MRVAVKNHALPVCKKNRIASLLCNFESTINKVSCILYLLYLGYIVHDIFWFKLVEMGVRGKILNVSKSIYSNLKSRVKFDNRVSSDFTSCLGSDRENAYLQYSFQCT